MSLKIGTIVYHDDYGKGKIKDIYEKEKSMHIVVYFPKKEINLEFIGTNQNGVLVNKHLPTEPSEEYLKREAKLAKIDSNNEQQKEKKFFDKIKKDVEDKIKVVADALKDVEYEYSHSKELNDKNVTKRYSEFVEENRHLVSIKNQPYFVKIGYDEFGKLKENYIGKNKFCDNVISWADPIAQMAYQPQLYLNDRENWKLKLKRDFSINLGEYYGYEDSINLYEGKENIESKKENVIIDKRLLNVLERRKDAKHMQDIIATIQNNQYDMITADKDGNNLVLGCAGSGKTMILIHRLTFLMLRGYVDLKNCFIISPTKFLNKQLIELSEELDINKTKILSISDFYKEILKDTYNKIKINSHKSIREFVTYNPQKFYSVDFLNKQYEKFELLLSGKSEEDFKLHNLIKKDILNVDNKNIKSIDNIENINAGFDYLYNETNRVSYDMFLKVRNEIRYVYDVYIKGLKNLLLDMDSKLMKFNLEEKKFNNFFKKFNNTDCVNSDELYKILYPYFNITEYKNRKE